MTNTTPIETAAQYLNPQSTLKGIRNEIKNRPFYRQDKQLQSAAMAITAILTHIDALYALFNKLNATPYKIQRLHSGSIYFTLFENYTLFEFTIRVSNHKCNGWGSNQAGDIRVTKQGDVVINSIVKRNVMRQIKILKSELQTH